MCESRRNICHCTGTFTSSTFDATNSFMADKFCCNNDPYLEKDAEIFGWLLHLKKNAIVRKMSRAPRPIDIN